MNYRDAIARAVEAFPFEGYMRQNGSPNGVYETNARSVERYLAKGSRILDFGCGPCDKTAVLQQMGYDCTGYDDLQDEWHRNPNNKNRIMEFISSMGVNFVMADRGPLPFAKASFDMVILNDVIEHWHDSPRDILNNLLELVKPEGYILITVPNAANIRKRLAVLMGGTNYPAFETYYWYPDSFRGHIREYVRADLVKLARFLSVEIVELKSCDHLLDKVPTMLRPVYLGVTAVFRGWKDGWLLIARRPQGWEPCRDLPPDQLANILNIPKPKS